MMRNRNLGRDEEEEINSRNGRLRKMQRYVTGEINENMTRVEIMLFLCYNMKYFLINFYIVIHLAFDCIIFLGRFLF